jgi:hypothetical protein
MLDIQWALLVMGSIIIAQELGRGAYLGTHILEKLQARGKLGSSTLHATKIQYMN